MKLLKYCNFVKYRISVCFQGKPLNITVVQVYAPTTDAEEAEVDQFYEDLQDLLELTHKKRCPFHHRGLEYKSRKSRDTWSNRQVWPWSTKRSRSKPNRVLPKGRTGHSKHPLPTTQEKTLHMDITRCQYRNQIDYLLCSQRWRSFIQSAKTKPGADHGSDRELLIAKFKLKLKKVRKFRYNLNSVGHSSITKIKSLMILQCK